MLMELSDFLWKGVMHPLTCHGLLGHLWSRVRRLSPEKGRELRLGLRDRPRLRQDRRYLLEGLNSVPLWKLNTLVLRPRE